MADELVSWSDDFLVGEETIDSQHKELVRLTNEFYSGALMGGVMAKVFFMQTIKGAMHYVKTHFATEEELMQKLGYPFFHEHKKQHENFISEVTQQILIFEEEDNPDPVGFVHYLMSWVLNHIAESDKKYSSYIT